jgi:23S rRNA pseudouridine2605 synthase
VLPVGRLDADTTGVLLLTNDGDLAHRLAHPRYQVDKVYEAEVEGEPSDAALDSLAAGVELDDGPTAPARAKRLAPSRIELSIHEGRKHQVKRMLEAVGHPVVRLHRSRYAGLTVEGLEPGEWRELTAEEVDSLRALTRRR